jgi:hypothetical protein
MELLIRRLTQTEKENVMLIPKEDFVLNQSTQWFRTLERHLGDMDQLLTRTRLAMVSMEAEVRRTIPKSSLTYHVRYRDHQPLPDAIRRGRICGIRPKMDSLPSASGKLYQRWFEPHKGPLKRDDLYRQVKDVGLQVLFQSYEDRKDNLNSARTVLVQGRTSIAARVRPRADPRAWEAGDLSLDPPLLLASGLPAPSIKALGGAWRIFLRMAAVRYELAALAERHNADPPYTGLWLAFRVDQAHPYGRFIWTLNGNRLSVIARRLAKGKHPRRVDEASLPDWLMRRLHIPAGARKAIRPHELRRRRMARIYGRYLAVLEPLLAAGPTSIKKAEELLRRAGLPESELTESFSDPIPMAM